MNAERAIGDTLEFDRAVKVARRFADEGGGALIIVLADARNRLLTCGTVPMSRPCRTQRSRHSSPRLTKKGGRSFPD
jgi:alkaline phosphatase